MGIDGIGKGKGITPPQSPAPSGTEGTSRTGGPSAPFQVRRSDEPTGAAAATAAGSAAEVSPALARLRAGEVDVHGYMDLRVEEATRGLEGLPPAELAEIKKVLRDQMATDPGLRDLVARATGETPSPPED